MRSMRAFMDARSSFIASIVPAVTLRTQPVPVSLVPGLLRKNPDRIPVSS
ncbi:hypothetical protein SAM23877_4944 [Streptomyces ambofaciens ATCC 23877]|uniref:Uncharacterized protein n=1 Tax=Streptomyces ambofaciens (strain ATCC 23877 / 3486 / DSM 40053 / JCM 4204 / NBRC 12836 / NRRL B-2516) TaxID=278992 RepID=A0A0K2AY83_STRA7|nr:hypothetical protein SAM23877_4944 [Streptomyces ambofaciens ATCC 23877]